MRKTSVLFKTKCDKSKGLCLWCKKKTGKVEKIVYNRIFSPVVFFKTSRIIGVSGSEVLSDFQKLRRDNNGY